MPPAAGFTTLGLLAGHAINSFKASQLSIVPNIMFYELELLANQSYKPSKPHVTIRLCTPNGDCTVPQ